MLNKAINKLRAGCPCGPLEVGALVKAARWRFRTDDGNDLLAEGAVGEVVHIKKSQKSNHVKVVALPDPDSTGKVAFADPHHATAYRSEDLVVVPDLRVRTDAHGLPVYAPGERRGTAQHVTESARAHSYSLSEEVPKTLEFWLLTFWHLKC